MSAQRIQWEGEYLKQAFADEIELAGVHPKIRARRVAMPTDLHILTELYPSLPRGNGFETRLARTTPSLALPRWRRSWVAAGPLIGELNLSIRQDEEEGTVSVGNGTRRRDITESFADHPNKDAAICAAIVRAAIRVCTEAREQQC
ncbi:hypothetical protein [Massilia sp. TN1-12]|uniref:hypothetical protein n=1 Tax=Massilia paldalensis TaxID=3377675 RepID=UPI00384C7E16